MIFFIVVEILDLIVQCTVDYTLYNAVVLLEISMHTKINNE